MKSKKQENKIEFWSHQSAEVSTSAHVGQNTKIWNNSQVLSGAHIGDNCTIGHNCLIASNAHLGNGVKLESNIDVWDGISIEDNVFVGPSAVFTNDKTPRAEYPKKQFPHLGVWEKTLIRYGASIGANVTILPGITIGKYALVGAGAVVANNVLDYALVVGVPAKQVGWVCECGNTLVFKKTKSKCQYCARCYTKSKKIISPTTSPML